MDDLRVGSRFVECVICGTLVLPDTERCQTTGAVVAWVVDAWQEARRLTRGLALALWSTAVIVLVVLAAMGRFGEYRDVVVLSVAALAIGGALVWKLADFMKPSWFTWAGED